MWLLQMALRGEADSMASVTTAAVWVAQGACDYRYNTHAIFARYCGVGREHSAEPRRCHPEKGRDSPETSTKEPLTKKCLSTVCDCSDGRAEQ
jgi:hypothetical protein